MSHRPRLLCSAAPPVFEDVPGDSGHPTSFTERLRRFLLNDGEGLFRAQERQAESHRKLEDTDPQPRN